MPYPVHVTDQLAFVQPPGIDEIMIFYARKRQRVTRVGMLYDGIGRRQQGDGAPFPDTPCNGGLHLHVRILTGQLAVIGGHQVTAFGGEWGRQTVPTDRETAMTRHPDNTIAVPPGAG